MRADSREREDHMNHEIIIERREHWLGHAWRCTCGRPLSTWMESEATARAAWRKHNAAAERRERTAA